MAHFDVLIHLRTLDPQSPAAAVGLKLAQRIGAWVTGVHVVGIAPPAFASPEAVAMQAQEADELFRDAQAQAGAWMAELGRYDVAGEWQVARGDAVEALCHAARWNDLVVVERSQLNPDAPTGWGVVSRTVFGSSTPVVVVPENARSGTAGTNIVIAWNHSREAALAIHGAAPLLTRAERVTVLEGESVDNPYGLASLPKLDLRAWLQRRGISAQFQPFSPGKEHGAAVLADAHAAGADLIVMGAWGHSRLTELVLGGSTRYLFQNSDLPLLVAH